MAKKYIGWGMGRQGGDQKYIIIVPATRKKDALSIFEELGKKVQDPKNVKRVCIVEYPGPTQVKAMPKQNWNKGLKEIKDED